MDIHELRQQPHLSASGISDYLDCGLLYKFSRIDRIPPEFISDALVFGSSIHKVLDEFHQEKMIGKRMTLVQIQESFHKHWRGSAEGNPLIRYSAGKDFETLLQEGKDLLACYYDKFPGDDFKPIAIEEPFAFIIDGLPVLILGVFDLIEQDESGTVIIVDWKTASKAYSADQIDKSLQLTLYKMAAEMNGYRDREILLRFDALIKTKTPKFEQYYTTRTEADAHRLVRKMEEIWRAISLGVFLPNDGHWKCKGCGYQQACADWFDS